MRTLFCILLMLFSFQVFSQDMPVLEEPYTWARVTEYHKQLGSRFFPSLPRMLEADLNKNGIPERFMLTRPYARGGSYTLFLYHDDMWHPFAQTEMSHLGFRVLESGNRGWHDFITHVPQWRGRQVWQFHYAFDGATYQLKEKRDIEWPDK